MSLRRNIGNILPAEQTDAEKVLSAISEPQILPGVITPATVPMAYTPSDVAPTNTTPVATIAAPAASDNTLLYLGVGAGLLFLIAGKKKKKVGATDGKKKSILPLVLVGGGVLAWYLYSNSQTAPASSTVTANTDTSTGTPATTTPVQTGITVEPSVTLPSDAQIYNQLYAYSVPWRYAVDRMTVAERQALYTYVYAFLQKGLRLYGYPGIYQDGYYDLNLYNTIKALNAKWSMGLLN